MLVQFVRQDDVIRHTHAMRNGLHDHLIHTAEARRLQAEAIAQAAHWGWTKSRRALDRLTNGLQGLVRLVRRTVLEPYARRRRRRIAIDQLRSLDDRVLADIGLRRSEIELAVDGLLPRRGDFLPQLVELSVPAKEVRHELPLAA